MLYVSGTVLWRDVSLFSNLDLMCFVHAVCFISSLMLGHILLRHFFSVPLSVFPFLYVSNTPGELLAWSFRRLDVKVAARVQVRRWDPSINHFQIPKEAKKKIMQLRGREETRVYLVKQTRLIAKHKNSAIK